MTKANWNGSRTGDIWKATFRGWSLGLTRFVECDENWDNPKEGWLFIAYVKKDEGTVLFSDTFKDTDLELAKLKAEGLVDNIANYKLDVCSF